jgi:ABC-type multidrug transport system fused ATPase/permease subunit
LGIVASVGIAGYYWHVLNIVDALGGFGPAMAHIGPAALIVLALMFLMSPVLLIALLLWLFVPVYPLVSFFYAWRRAVQRVVEAYTSPLADRLSSLVVERLASLPDAQNRSGQLRKWLAEDSVSGKLESVLGGSFWARRAARFAAKRLPWAELLADWEKESAQHAGEDVQSLAPALSSHIAKALNAITAPSRLPFIVVVAAHAVLFGLGIWLGLKAEMAG